MSRGTLITRPDYDLATTYLYYWSSLIVNLAKKSGTQILDLSGRKANLRNLLSYTQKRKPGFLFFNGHGGPDFIMGYDNEILIDMNNYKEILEGSIIYSRSCESGQILGPECARVGAAAFVGYSRKFMVGYLDEKKTRPLTDSLARLFLEPSNFLAQSIMSGDNVQTSHNKSRSMMYKNLRYMLSSKATLDERDAAQYLWNNMKYQVIFGNDKASI